MGEQLVGSKVSARAVEDRRGTANRFIGELMVREVEFEKSGMLLSVY